MLFIGEGEGGAWGGVSGGGSEGDGGWGHGWGWVWELVLVGMWVGVLLVWVWLLLLLRLLHLLLEVGLSVAGLNGGSFWPNFPVVEEQHEEVGEGHGDLDANVHPVVRPQFNDFICVVEVIHRVGDVVGSKLVDAL